MHRKTLREERNKKKEENDLDDQVIRVNEDRPSLSHSINTQRGIL